MLLILVFCVTSLGTSFAQNNLEGMKLLTIYSLVQYGQRLYDRGDYNEACAVFNHVLTFDGHQAQALRYLREMGHFPVSNFEGPTEKAADILDTKALREAIKAKKQSIEKLRAQITQMRASLASQNAVELLN